jgi:thiamine biosynthesis lipoprotein
MTLARSSWRALGTTASVVTDAPGALGPACRAVEAELAAIDLACSRFREDSELSRLNRSAGLWVEVGPVLHEAIGVALRAAAATAGSVDPTVGAALVLAGYDRDFAELGPATRRVRAIRAPAPGWRTVAVDDRAHRIRVPAGTQLDLGATAKALAADRAAARAAARLPGVGILVDLGGDIALAGPAPAAGWTVRIAEDHAAPLDADGPLVQIRSGGLATSSTTVRRWAPGAHHIIDPATGEPTAGAWRTVSVAAASCVDANTASTAAIVRGAPGRRWLEEQRLPSRLVGDGGEVVTVAGWPSEPALAA